MEAENDGRVGEKMKTYHMVTFKKNIVATQAKGCRFCLHVGSWVWYFGYKSTGVGARLELVTPLHWFRYNKG